MRGCGEPMSKRKNHAILQAPLMLAVLVMFMVLVMFAGPSHSLAEATSMKPPAMAGKGAGKPGEWEDYDPSKQRGAKGGAEQLPSGTLVVIAYIIIWAVVLLYVLVLALRQRRLRAEVQQLRRRLDEVDPPPTATSSEKT